MPRRTSPRIIVIGRNAINGRFTTVQKAIAHPRTHIVQHIRKGK